MSTPTYGRQTSVCSFMPPRTRSAETDCITASVVKLEGNMANLEIPLEAQGSLPNFRYDIILPLMSGRAPIDGVTLKPSGPNDSAGYYTNPKFENGEFGLLDTNIGDVIPAIANGWKIVCLPVFIKRKPSYNYLFVRSDRGINSPKDLE